MSREFMIDELRGNCFIYLARERQWKLWTWNRKLFRGKDKQNRPSIWTLPPEIGRKARNLYMEYIKCDVMVWITSRQRHYFNFATWRRGRGVTSFSGPEWLGQFIILRGGCVAASFRLTLHLSGCIRTNYFSARWHRQFTDSVTLYTSGTVSSTYSAPGWRGQFDKLYTWVAAFVRITSQPGKTVRSTYSAPGWRPELDLLYA